MAKKTVYFGIDGGLRRTTKEIFSEFCGMRKPNDSNSDETLKWLDEHSEKVDLDFRGDFIP